MRISGTRPRAIEAKVSELGFKLISPPLISYVEGKTDRYQMKEGEMEKARIWAVELSKSLPPKSAGAYSSPTQGRRETPSQTVRLGTLYSRRNVHAHRNQYDTRPQTKELLNDCRLFMSQASPGAYVLQASFVLWLKCHPASVFPKRLAARRVGTSSSAIGQEPVSAADYHRPCHQVHRPSIVLQDHIRRSPIAPITSEM